MSKVVIEIFKVKTCRSFKFLKPPQHDCYFFRLCKYRVRVGDGKWYGGGDNQKIDIENV